MLPKRRGKHLSVYSFLPVPPIEKLIKQFASIAIKTKIADKRKP